MKSPNPPCLPAPAGVYRLRTAGVADPCATAGGPGPTDLLVALGPAEPSTSADWPAGRSIRVLASGSPAEVDASEAMAASGSSGVVEIDLTGSVVMPGLVNAHTHLDLTHLRPMLHDPTGGFVGWVDRIRAGRASEPAAIRASVERGIELSLRAGVVLVGDIAGAPAGQPSLEPLAALAESPLAGVSFLEFFAMGSRERESLERLDAALQSGSLPRAPRERAGERAPSSSSSPCLDGGSSPGCVRLGLQPHAPNTVSLPAYRRAVGLAREFGLPLSTHLAETPEEREFIAKGSGPQREMLERFGFWDDSILEHVGKGRSPIEHLEPVLDAATFLLAHVNDLGEERERAIDTLVRTGASVAYCPRASAYFDAPAHFGPHAYREMLAAGVNVCLGTDSIVNLPAGVDAPDGPGLGVLDEARLLFARDGADPATLLGMMTVNGCRALGWDEAACSLAPGAEPMGLVVVDVAETSDDRLPIERVLGSRSHAQLLAIGAVGSSTGWSSPSPLRGSSV